MKTHLMSYENYSRYFSIQQRVALKPDCATHAPLAQTVLGTITASNRDVIDIQLQTPLMADIIRNTKDNSFRIFSEFCGIGIRINGALIASNGNLLRLRLTTHLEAFKPKAHPTPQHIHAGHADLATA